MTTPQEFVPLAKFTTLNLGGNARYFVECSSIEDIRSAIDFARTKALPYHILGGGSNTIFRDEGFPGLVIKIALQGRQFIRDPRGVRMVAAAGEEWDGFVQSCINFHLAGVECLSGIPGLVGATPIQNVGAYGQEVSDSIVEVKAIDRDTLLDKKFGNHDCEFGYRKSRFNQRDAGQFIITEVTFQLHQFGDPAIRYPELQNYLESQIPHGSSGNGKTGLQAVRGAVLFLRQRKSMVIDKGDPNSRSAGSFFKNPVLTTKQFQELEERCTRHGITSGIPTYSFGSLVKVPAAWLLENAGFRKGYRKGGVGISANHSLALVNFNGTTNELLSLAESIQSAVLDKFGLSLEREPVLVP